MARELPYSGETRLLTKCEPLYRVYFPYLLYVTSAYFVLTGYRHSELGRVVLNTCISTRLFTVKFANCSPCDVNAPTGLYV